MVGVMNLWLKIPFGFRVTIVLFLFVIIWRILGKRITWLLGYIPLALKKIFWLLYWIIAFPLSIIREKFGHTIHNIDNLVADIWKKWNSFLDNWYQNWRSNYEFHWDRILIIYSLCVICIIVPSKIDIDNELLKKGEEWYLFVESAILREMNVKIEEKDIQEVAIVKEDVTISDKKEIIEIELIVSGVNSSLLVRDIPNMVDGIALERLHNGDIVTWNGQILFAEAENMHIEAWAKVKTNNNVEGWSRLYYLHPMDYENKKYYVKVQSSMVAD